LNQLAKRSGLDKRVEFTGRLEPEELRPLTCRADLGISLEEDLGLNYRYALPNKIFDYIQCRVPVLCSDLPEMKKLVEGYGVGKATAERDPEKLAIVIRDMLHQSSNGVYAKKLEDAAQELCWEKESEYYIAVLKSSL
jgi:glycosyltransferase involved in cell wall biosynthesis